MNLKQWKEILIETELGDVLTDKTYNEDYSVEVRLTVKEIREIANILKKIHQVVTSSAKEEYVPRFGWCDVDGCNIEGCCGGTAWRDKGYWVVCSKHSADSRKGLPMPKMKKESISRENSRDKITGHLPMVGE